MDYGVNGNGMDGEFKGNILILETGKMSLSIDDRSVVSPTIGYEEREAS